MPERASCPYIKAKKPVFVKWDKNRLTVRVLFLGHGAGLLDHFLQSAVSCHKAGIVIGRRQIGLPAKLLIELNGKDSAPSRTTGLNHYECAVALPPFFAQKKWRRNRCSRGIHFYPFCWVLFVLSRGSIAPASGVF